jgi:oligopeptide transport system permease protein
VTRLLLSRLFGGIIVVFCVATFAFFMLRAAPGGPFDEDRPMPPQVKRNLEKAYNLDQPAAVQWGRYMVGLIPQPANEWRPDLGISPKQHRKVWDIVVEHFPHSLKLGVLAILFASIFGTIFGVFAAARQNSIFDHASMSFALFGISVPAFVLAPLLILVFSINLALFPPARFEGFSSMILPSMTLGLIYMGVIARLARSGMLETLRQDYIRTARAKGLEERSVVVKHAVPLGLLPVVTYLGPAVAALITGSFVVEKIFQIPGLGFYFVDSMVQRDYPLLTGSLVVYSIFLVILNLAVDIMYGVLDPRIRESRGQSSGGDGEGMRGALRSMIGAIIAVSVIFKPGTWVAVGRAMGRFLAGIPKVMGKMVRAMKGLNESHSLWGDAWRRLKKNRMALWCGGAFLFIFCFSFFGPPIVGLIAGIDGVTPDPALGAVPPSAQHWMGTDPLGRDMMVRIMEGGRWAIIAGFVATAVALVIGVAWGAIAAYAGGKTDEVMMRFVDVMYAFPRVVFVIVIMAVLDTRNLAVIFALIGAISWLNMARIVRGQVLSLRHREFVEAARATGLKPGRILFRHIIPNTLGPIIVYSTLSLPSVMLTEAFLSFLGLGVQAPKASWGTLVTEGASQIAVNPWTLIGPGLVMGVTIFALNFLGDGLRDALDPQMRK